MSSIKEKYKYLWKNTLIFAISSFSTKFLSFLLVPLYTSFLSTAEYGKIDLITTTSTLLVYVLTINIADSVLRFTIENVKESEKILAVGLKTLTIGSCICACLLMTTYLVRVLDWNAIDYFYIFLFFFFTALYQIMTNYLRGRDKIREVATAGIISAVAIIVSNILLLLVFKIGIDGYLISMITGPAIASVFCLFCGGKLPEIKHIFLNRDKFIKAEMFAYCIPLIFNNIALWVNGSLDKYFVTGLCGISENGIYSIASKIPHILDACIIVFSQAWNLSAIKEFDSQDKDGFFSKTFNIYGFLMAATCSAIILMNIPLAKFLYNKEFFAAWQYSSILLIATMFNTLTAFIGSVFSAVKKTKIIAISTVTSALVNTILNACLIPLFGAYGAAIATVIAYITMYTIRLVVLQDVIKLQTNWGENILTYMLLFLQVIFEHMDRHFYIGQIICLISICLINYRLMQTMIEMLKNRILQRRS